MNCALAGTLCVVGRSDGGLCEWLTKVLSESQGKRHEVQRRVLPPTVFAEVRGGVLVATAVGSLD